MAGSGLLSSVDNGIAARHYAHREREDYMPALLDEALSCFVTVARVAIGSITR